MNFDNNCVFLDEAGFNLHMTRTRGWFKKGAPAKSTVPASKGTTITILGAISIVHLYLSILLMKIEVLLVLIPLQKPAVPAIEDLLLHSHTKINFQLKIGCPLHSYIINTNDEAWKIAFEADEVEEIMEASSNNGFNNPLPNEMLDILSKLDKKKTFDEMYQAFKNVEADRYYQRTLYCASGSMASEAKNGSRTLGTNQALTRQEAGDYADLVFKTMSTEVACVEISLEDLGSKGTKELQEKLLKTPKMMKAFCARITEQYPQAKTEEIKIIGYVISGMYITALEMSFKKGSVALISSSERLKMPESIKQIPDLLPPVLALVYNCTQAIKSTVNYIDDVSSSFSLNRCSYDHEDMNSETSYKL
ncbi:hypothetical protein G6F37_012293 [Rhizopus arrhizus]|nr:hypothetical protein G6F37_012293 [Rhizopus arrhizus]